MFGKKTIKCSNCNSKVNEKYSFCPDCGNFLNEETEAKEYGLLGRDDNSSEMPADELNFGIADKLINSLMNSLIKNMDKQFKQFDQDSRRTEIKNLPNGIKIRIGTSAPQNKKAQRTGPFQKQLSEEQIEKMSFLPRTQAKSKMKRMGDKIIYELDTPGILSPQDIFISKLESGYEIKAISEKQDYVNILHQN